MVLKKYNDFILFSLLESMTIESKLELSENLVNLLVSMPTNRIKDIIINLFSKGKVLDINQNYLDVGSSNDEVTFIASSRANALIKDHKETWSVRHRGGRLTFGKNDDGTYKNQVIFDDFKDYGFDPETAARDIPPDGTVGEILSQTPSRETAGKIYVLFKWDDNLSIYNKRSLSEVGDLRSKIESLSRNPTRIGRVVRAILTAAGESFTDKEIEGFVNLYKSVYDISKDTLAKLRVVSGDKIAYWYDSDRYDGDNGTLGGSCMAHKSSQYFKIYSSNPDVCSMIILFAPPYKMGEDGKPYSEKIKGRALLWNTDSGEKYMDRIYTNDDSDTEIFKTWAKENGYWVKVRQAYGTPFSVQKDGTTKRANWTVSLNKFNFDRYPFVDSFPFMDDCGEISTMNRGRRWVL
ncbi:hypothetical protein EBU94_02095, partial [bacterium]|nr:hypothetical protein [bacterium]